MDKHITLPVKIEAFSGDEYLLLLRRLECHHAIFYWLWAWGMPYFNDQIPTAQMTFTPYDGSHIGFEVSPSFWKTLTQTQKEFIICHEILHVILNHGIRSISLKNKDLANIAMDLVINQTLVDNFGFNIDDIDPKKVVIPSKPPMRSYCWIEQYFPQQPGTLPISTIENFEYYYNLLEKKYSGNPPNRGGVGDPLPGGGRLCDDHTPFLGKDFSNTLEEIGNKLTPEEFKDIKHVLEEQSIQDTRSPGGTSTGTSPGNLVKLIQKIKIVVKHKWETIIKKWSSKYFLDEYKEQEQWTHINRRLVTLSRDLFIPTIAETNERFVDKTRIRVWFFLDTSGSCAHLANRFFKAAETLPKKRFDINLFCFDTQCYKTDFKSRKLYGFGGTSFSCIEAYIQSEIKKSGEAYPKACFIITDGAGDSVVPEFPKRWYWFLSDNYKQYIPKDSNVYMLADFE